VHALKLHSEERGTILPGNKRTVRAHVQSSSLDYCILYT